MTKKTILFFLIIISPIVATAQDQMAVKLSKQLCKCLEKNEVTSMDAAGPCFEQMILKNLEKMYAFYKVERLDQLDFEKISAEIGAHLAKNCDYMETMIDDSYKIDKDILPEANLDCAELKNGEFYYAFPNEVTKVNDTTFVTIKDKMYLERMNNGKTYSLLDIQWVNDCQFELIFKDSNDLFKSNMSNVGDKYEYQVMSSTSNSFIIKVIVKDEAYKYELFKKE